MAKQEYVDASGNTVKLDPNAPETQQRLQAGEIQEAAAGQSSTQTPGAQSSGTQTSGGSTSGTAGR